jgi:D-tyrosyl-tRNA(Tyr) deacylase
LRAVVQRVSRAEVRVDGTVVGKVATGLVVLVGVAVDDEEADAQRLAEKIAGLRIFEDKDGAMNLALAEIAGSVLLISQFTLLGDARKGRRPSFIEAAPGPIAEQLYERVASFLRREGIDVQTGRFGATKDVELVNAGPVTILLDTKRLF